MSSGSEGDVSVMVSVMVEGGESKANVYVNLAWSCSQSSGVFVCLSASFRL